MIGHLFSRSLSFSNRTLTFARIIILSSLIFPIFVSAQEESSSASSYKIIKVTNGGTISGVVRFEDKFPPQKKLRVSKDKAACGGHKLSEKFLVAESNKGLQNVLVTVEGISSGKAPKPVSTVEIEQKGCTYIPHFQVAEIGTDGVEIKFFNNDGIFHNVHAQHNDTTLFNIPQFGDQVELLQTIKIPGIIKLKCDVHSWMGANIVLLRDKPYYAVTDSTGHFTISDLPTGTYTLHGWHEALGTMKKEVTVSASKTTETEFVIKPKGKKKGKSTGRNR